MHCMGSDNPLLSLQPGGTSCYKRTLSNHQLQQPHITRSQHTPLTPEHFHSVCCTKQQALRQAQQRKSTNSNSLTTVQTKMNNVGPPDSSGTPVKGSGDAKTALQPATHSATSSSQLGPIKQPPSMQQKQLPHKFSPQRCTHSV